MPAPTPEVFQRSIGRYGEATFRAKFTSAENDDLTDVPVLSQNYLSGKTSNTRFKVTNIAWTSEGIVSGVVEFTSVPSAPEGMVLAITPDASSGALNFCHYPNGGKSDPNRTNPGDLCISTKGAVPGSEIFLSLTYIEKGNTNPGAA